MIIRFKKPRAFEIIASQKLIPFLPTPVNVVERMLEISDPKPGELLIDLGSGDGRIPLIAAKKYDCMAVGIEINPKLVEISRRKVFREQRLAKKVQIVHGNLFTADLSNAGIITMYLTPTAISLLKPKLERELKDGTRVVCHDYPIPGWRPILTEEIKSHGAHVHKIYLYKVPESIPCKANKSRTVL